MTKKNIALAGLLAGELPKMEKQIAASKWYGVNENKLRKKFGGNFIAIRGREVKSSKTSGELLKKIDNSSEWFITFVPKQKVLACW